MIRDSPHSNSDIDKSILIPVELSLSAVLPGPWRACYSCFGYVRARPSRLPWNFEIVLITGGLVDL